ncbi:hypothetical protein K402DRAFT_393057 [Aulographum hederae CBS 113979]|uniref:Galactose oxidase n=1 Tax=Aulographum hederae CBS 113979 TaxID=1176131 RepID=A0A6G1H2A0_9PEZI|nr:hypothetical protein K402DRAFT_393057 [Aulographum hederae CBS 113979]
MEPAVAGALYAAESLLEGAFAFGKGILYPTLPLKATFSRIKGARFPRAGHTISIVKGRAYIFGGETSVDTIASNDMSIVILPSSAVSEADYTVIPARPRESNGPVPQSRKHHSAVVVGDSIYILGGQLPPKSAEEEKGRIWVFDTVTKRWSYIDPASPPPPARSHHSASSSELPGPKEAPRPSRDILPQQPPEPGSDVPEPPQADSWGTMFIYGGKHVVEGKLLNDAWTFDFRTRTWHSLPDPPEPGRTDASLAAAGSRLYRFGGYDGNRCLGGSIDWLDVGNMLSGSRDTALGELEASSLGDWEEHAFEKEKGPSPRAGAGLVDVTTGQGRGYLLLVGGESVPSTESGTGVLFDDAWAFQLPPAATSAASAKDQTRTLIKKDTKEAVWAEVQYQYPNGDGDAVKDHPSGKIGAQGSGSRSKFAVAKGTEVDGATVVLWGGSDENRNILDDGWMITVDR